MNRATQKKNRSKPRIFIHMHYMEIGGAETSLIGLLQTLDPKRVEVDLFLNEHRGEMMRYIPAWVNVLPEDPTYRLIERPMLEVLQHGHLRLFFARLRAKYLFTQYEKRKCPKDGSAIFGYIGKCVSKVLPKLQEGTIYDLAISFLTPHNIVKHKVTAKQKMAWIHTDYSSIDVNNEMELSVWSSYDSIAAVSADVRYSFLLKFPSLADKVCVVENILSPKFICSQATLIDVSDEMPRKVGEYILCSVGRFCAAKNFDNVPSICRKLIDRGIRFKWYIIGYGGDEPLVHANIRQAGMEQVCILLGKKQNPYPYMAACDVYVQPSRYEGKAVTVREAQILGKPVVITRFPTATSQLTDGVDGIIVPLDNDGCANALADFIDNKELQEKIVGNLKCHDYGNETEARKVESIAYGCCGK